MSSRKAYINVDLGEGYGNYSCGPDEHLIPMIDHANVACGFHAGDPLHMQQAVRQCKERGIKVGAHPGLPDVQGFGRREMKLSPEEHTANIIYQVGALRGFLDAEGVELNHVKPHGILRPRGIKVFGLAGTCQETVAAEMGLEFVVEFYGDVKYDDDGRLVIDRVKKPWRAEDVKRHVRQQLQDSAVTSSVSGKVVPLPTKDYAISVCCHSDSPGCLEIVTATREVVDEYNKANGFS
ncbi:lactam utilization protein lamB [Apiospora kogelbergensis]|uniref:lactam utilization protein lamB n=1 Tax=Apiospora kogelbergensis TaxID=1337665 RepID=UPI003131BD35